MAGGDDSMIELDRQSIVDFVIREAALLDDGDLAGWLALYAADCCYWIPAGPGERDPSREVSIVYDDRPRLESRLARLTSGKEYAQDPPSVTCHQLSNISIGIEPDGGMIAVAAVQVVYECRPSTGLQAVPTRIAWRLRVADGRLQIVEKRITLVDYGRYYQNLTFVL